MTISSLVSRVDANGNGSATVFSFSPVVIFAASNLVVIKRAVDGTETTITPGAGATQYTLSISTFPNTGSITYPSTGGTRLLTGEKLIMKRVVPLLQTTRLENQGAYLAAVQESAFDYAMAAVQQQQEQIGRTLQLAETDVSTPVLFPSSVVRANQLLGFDGSGNPVAAQSASATVSTPMQPVVSAASLAAAMVLLASQGIARNLVSITAAPAEVAQVGYYLDYTGLDIFANNNTVKIGSASTGLVVFYNGNGTSTAVGSITTGGTSTAYNTTSDYRIKITYGPANVGAAIDDVPVYDAAFKALPNARRPMMLAHEMQAAGLGWAVTGTKDAKDEEGRDALQMVDYAGLVPLLWAELKSVRARLAALEAA